MIDFFAKRCCQLVEKADNVQRLAESTQNGGQGITQRRELSPRPYLGLGCFKNEKKFQAFLDAANS